jgi:hypothetical protein
MTNLDELLSRARSDLRESGCLLVLATYLAASELIADELQPADAGRLRAAATELALESVGIDEQLIEELKLRLGGARRH